jgi:hypothetical protein
MKAKPNRRFIVYVRDAARRPQGLILVYRANNGDIKVGFSKCHPNDRWDRKQALIVAFQRAVPVKEAGSLLAPRGFRRHIDRAILMAGPLFDNQLKSRPIQSKRKARTCPTSPAK